jgi:Zn-dependent protease
MTAITLLLPIVLALALGLGLTILLTGVKMSRLRLKPMRTEPIDLARVPQATRAVLDIGRVWLVARGFRYLSSWKTRPMVVKATEWRFSDVYVGDDGVTFAIVTPREAPRPGDITSIEFQSVFADGVVMSTFNRYRHALVWESPNWKVSDDLVSDLSQALENHRRRVRDCGKTPLGDPAERDRISNARLTSFMDGMVDAGKAYRLPNGEMRMRFVHSLGVAARLIRGNTRAGKVQIVPLAAPTAAAAGTSGGAEAGSVAADMNSYLSRRALDASASNTGKWRFGALSAVAFVAVGALLWDPVFAVILLGVIAFHEGGHYIAMKAVGYRNLHVFFVPGLGGLATGEKEDASAAQKVLVYLAGPVPGIALATAGLIAIPAEISMEYPWLHQLLTVTLYLNLINLLPVTPLDGGRVMEVLLFMRWPRLRVVFTAVSAAVLIAVGVLFGERGMLLIGVLVGLTLPSKWRFSQLARAIRRAPAERMDERPAAQRVFTAMAAEPFTKWTYQHRCAAADELISQLRTPTPGIAMVGTGLVLYAACFVAPLAAALLAMPGPGIMDTARAVQDAQETIAMMQEEQDAGGTPAPPPRNWTLELEQAKEAPQEQRLALLTDAAENGFFPGKETEEDIQAGRAEMRRIAETLPRGNVTRVRALLVAMDDDGGISQRHQADLRALMEELNGTTPEVAALRGRIGVTLAGDMQSSPERLQLLKQARDGMAASAKPGDAYMGEAWSMLADELAKQGDPAAADAEWRALLKWYADALPGNQDTKIYVDSARRGYARFLIGQARFDDAEAFLRPFADDALAQAAQGKRAPLMRASWQLEDLFWIAIRKGDTAQATKWLDATSKSPLAARRPQFALAQLAAADLSRDEKETAEARRRIAEMKTAPVSLCKPGLSRYEGTELEAKRSELLRRYEICKGQST